MANAHGTPSEGLPTYYAGSVSIEPSGPGRTPMSVESRSATAQAMEKILAMGMQEGLTQAVAQIDEILAAA